ncbi:hypothetical protein ACX3UL_09900 [Actinomyces urogenitalis]
MSERSTTSVLAALARWLQRRITAQIDGVSDQARRAAEASVEAAGQAAAARDGVTNSHGTHLRDDVDGLIAAVADLTAGQTTMLQRMDAAEMARIAEAEARESRDRRAELQIDGLRDDLRAHTASSDRAHQVIHSRIDSIKHPDR